MKYRYPVFLSTKSDLILRDLGLLSKIADNNFCTIAFTITTFNNKIVNFLEPIASPPLKRIEALEKIKQTYPKIQTGVNLMPIIPFMEDSDENLEEIVLKTKEANCDFILFAPGMFLRDLQANFFFNKLKNSKYKEILPKLLNLYKGEMRHQKNIQIR